ncbi:MAG: NAD(P)/FAD-dependent oxidoreductase [Desulfobacterales bacterium]|nr:NAD(P)/FAD-dependent oxidoreductase [Desulfobacterales bacterium]
MRKKVMIIGAGIAGLSAGCYLQMNGYDTEIVELHNQPGGLCTSWKRKGYTIDGCIHWLMGSSPSDEFYSLWNELIDMKSIQFINHDVSMQFEDRTGNVIRFFSDVDRLEKELLEKAKQDKKMILSMTKAIRKLRTFKLPVSKAPETYTFLDFIRFFWDLIPYYGELNKWIRISASEYANNFQTPLLRKAIRGMFWPDMNMLFIILMMVWFDKKTAGYPIGGSLAFSRLFEKRYLELGGKIHYKSKVIKIITEKFTTIKDKATGILLDNEQSYSGDIIISAADGHYTLFEMLSEIYHTDQIKNYYSTYPMFSSYIQVSLGIQRTFDQEPHMASMALNSPIVIDPMTSVEDISLRIFNFDPTLADKGSTLITLMFTTYNHDYWNQLRQQDPDTYKKEKDRIANDIIDVLDKRYGNIRSQVEMIDVSTPATVIRYTNNYKGSYEGWVWTPQIGFKTMSKELPRLKNFYMIGQWVEPGGGLPPALLSGRNVCQLICMQDHKPFVVR